MAKWMAGKATGVRWYEHQTRKNGRHPDRYYTIRFKVNNKLVEEALGWASEGWNEAKASAERSKLKEAQRTGEGATTLAEKRGIAQAEKQAALDALERQRQEKVSFVEIFEKHYLPQQEADGKKPRSISREKALVKIWIAPVMGDLSLREVDYIHLEQVKASMQEKNSPRSIHYALAVIRQVFNFAISRKLFDGNNPIGRESAVKKPTYNNARERYLKEYEATLLLSELGQKSPITRDMAVLSLHCGLRAGEIFNLTWDCVDISNNKLTVRDPKNKVTRYVSMSEKAKAVFTARVTESSTGLVFEVAGGGAYRWVPDAFKKAVKAVGLNNKCTDSRGKVVFHTLRHTYASWCVQKGVPLVVLKEWMGHKTLTMTLRYAHLAPDNHKLAIDLFADAPG